MAETVVRYGICIKATEGRYYLRMEESPIDCHQEFYVAIAPASISQADFFETPEQPITGEQLAEWFTRHGDTVQFSPEPDLEKYSS